MQSATVSRLLRRPMVAACVLLLLAIWAAPAQAVPGPVGPTPRTGPNTDIVMSGTGPGQGVTGAYGPADFDPTAGGYPASPPAGFTPLNEGFAGIITARSETSGETLSMYCIDLRTSTWAGIGYENGSWDQSNVPNVGYIARILDEYYPNTNEPAAADVNQRAAAVQAAIWYFSDKYVLQANDPVRSYTTTSSPPSSMPAHFPSRIRRSWRSSRRPEPVRPTPPSARTRSPRTPTTPV